MSRYNLDRRLTAMMIEDMQFNPVLAARVILKLKIPPHQELRLFQMWGTYYTIDDSGFSTGKTQNHAVIAALRCCLFSDRIVGILSKTFAQGKLIFDYFDRWYSSAPIFRYCIKHYKSSPRLVHGTDSWVAYFRGQSQIRVLPPDFMKDAERVRSERWNDGHFDEWTTFSNFEAFNKTIIGRVTRVNKYINCPVRQNHIHLASTPGFTFEPAYKIVKRAQHQIAQNNKDYGRFTCNYRHVPDTKEWEYLINRKVIFHMQNTLPPGIIESEVNGLWQADSSSFYSYKEIKGCRWNIAKAVTKRKNENEIFLAGMDSARGGVSRSGQTGRGDDFSLTVLRVSGDDKPQHCLTIRKSNVSAKQMSGIIHKWHSRLGFSFIAYDPGGGGLFVRDELREKKQTIEGSLVNSYPICELEDRSGAIGDRILIPITRAGIYVSQMWGKMANDSVLVNRIHKEVSDRIANKEIFLAGEWEGWHGDESQWDVDSKREWLNKNGHSLSEEEMVKAEMDLAVSQLVMVDVERDENKEPVVDNFGMFKFKSKHKKDSAYSLVYSVLCYILFKFVIKKDINFSRTESMPISSGVI